MHIAQSVSQSVSQGCFVLIGNNVKQQLSLPRLGNAVRLTKKSGFLPFSLLLQFCRRGLWNINSGKLTSPISSQP